MLFYSMLVGSMGKLSAAADFKCFLVARQHIFQHKTSIYLEQAQGSAKSNPVHVYSEHEAVTTAFLMLAQGGGYNLT